MGLKGYLNPKTYCSITNLFYEKELKRCTAHIEIFEDETKQFCLASTGVVANGDVLIRSLLTLTPQKSVPSDLKNSFFIVDDNPSDDLAGLNGRLACMHPVLNELQTYFLTEGIDQYFYLEDEKKYVRHKNGKWEDYNNMKTDKRIWDKWFAPEVALADGTNPTKQMYKFMKTLDQFKDCEDV